MKITKSRDLRSFTRDGVRIRDVYVVWDEEGKIHMRWSGHTPASVDDERVRELIREETEEIINNPYPIV